MRSSPLPSLAAKQKTAWNDFGGNNPHYFRMDYWLNQARWLENNGGSDAAIENAYYQYMVASDAYNAAVDAYC